MKLNIKKPVITLILSQFLVCLGISLVIPVMPFLKNIYHFSALEMGIMQALFAFSQFIFSPFFGRLSDRMGRKNLLIDGLLLFIISEFMFAKANSLFLFNVSRFIGGVSAAIVVPISNALAADLTNEIQRAKVIGFLAAAFSGGLILGPGIGGILANHYFKDPFWLAGILGFISMLAVIIFLPTENKHLKSSRFFKRRLFSFNFIKNWGTILDKRLFFLLILILFTSFGLIGFESVYTLYVNAALHFSLGNIALALTLNGIISLILQVFFFDALVRRWGEIKIIKYGFLFCLIGAGWLILAHLKIEAIIATLFFFEAEDLIRPALTTLLTKLSAKNQGLINGLNVSLSSLGNIFGPIISGKLLDIHLSYPYLVVVIFMVVSFITTSWLEKRFRFKTLN